MKKIYAQGYFDGACFLYSAANAYRTLTGKDIGKLGWTNAIKNVFFPEDFLDGGAKGGTTRYNDDTVLFGAVLKHMFSNFAGKNEMNFTITPQSIGSVVGLKKLITPSSVVIFCYQIEKNGKIDINHWTCGVAHADSPVRIRAACSSSELDEIKDETSSRWYNEEIKNDKSTKICEGSVFQVALTA